ncbi:hypothetical protein EPO33_01625 [Patescibacteria group bacterium]|nr:MAG: hypothetical protein EPO33_01625 [Patescibacteria group bacterium]
MAKVTYSLTIVAACVMGAACAPVSTNAAGLEARAGVARQIDFLKKSAYCTNCGAPRTFRIILQPEKAPEAPQT